MLKSLLVALLLFVLIGCGACVRNRPYRIPMPIANYPSTAVPPIAFVEFDDMGELWDRCRGTTEQTCEYRQALNLINTYKNGGRNLVAVTFIHGWKNNAAPGNSDLEHFQTLLTTLQAGDPENAYIGIYLAWRGKIAKDPVTAQLSFWNRRHAAMRIAAVSMTEVILNLSYQTKGNRSKDRRSDKFIVIGHSFGGLILERAMAQAVTGLISNPKLAVPCGDRLCFEAPADLVVLLNPALESIETQQLIDMLARKNIRVRVQEEKQRQYVEYPLFISITGQNDWGTGIALPAGHFFEALGKSFRNYEPIDKPECRNAPSQRKLYTHTAGHLAYFFTHNAVKTPCDADKRTFLSETPEVTSGYHLCERPASERCNKTPYWIVSVNKELINGHTGIWGSELQKMLFAMIRLTALRQSTSLTMQ